MRLRDNPHIARQDRTQLLQSVAFTNEEQKLHIAAQIEDEARHTVFFDRFYREVVGIEGADIMEVLDRTFPWVQETFVGPFGLLAYQADELRRNPYDQRARVRYGTTYFLWIEGVLALSVMKVTLSYARWRGFLPAYYTGFTATCRDESRQRPRRRRVTGIPAASRMSAAPVAAATSARSAYARPPLGTSASSVSTRAPGRCDGHARVWAGSSGRARRPSRTR